MDRRLFLAAIAATSAAPAVAQTTPSTTMSTTGVATKGAINAAPTDMANLGTPEKLHITQTMDLGTLSLALSRIALRDAEHPDVKEFAKFEVAEQETVANVLTAVKTAAGDMTPAPKLDKMSLDLLQTLQEARGAAFDRAYVEGQIQGHRKLLVVQADYLATGKVLGSTNIAKLASGMIQEHLQLLADIKQQLSGAKG